MASYSPTSPGHLFKLIADGAVSTRRQLGEVTGLSRTTVSAIVDQLITAGLVRVQGSDGLGMGRPAGILVFEDERPTILVADLGATHGRVAVTNARGEIFAERVILSEIATGPEAVLARVCDIFDELLDESARDRNSICGIGIGLAGAIDFGNGQVVRAPLMPAWHGFKVREAVNKRFGAPVFVDNDANLMALGEFSRVYPRANGLVFIKVGTGIGSGLISHGELLRGAQGAEGDLGHVKISGEHGICACGAEGCLAAVASGRAILKQLRSQGVKAEKTSDLVSLLDNGHPDAISLVSQSGRLMGEVLATVVAMLNPDVLVVGGDIGQVEHLRRALHERLLQLTHPLATSDLIVSGSALGDRAGILGGVELVKSQVFSAASVDEYLDRMQQEKQEAVNA